MKLSTGNLELRLGDKSMYASTTHNGFIVYEAIPILLGFLDANPSPPNELYEEWFENTSMVVFPRYHHDHLIGGVSNEVIIDVPRKLILHDGNEGRFQQISDSFPEKFEKWCNALENIYHFEIHRYSRPETRAERWDFIVPT